MEFEFTEGDYDGAYRFGGTLKITANGAMEVESLISHFRLFRDVSDVSVLQERINALQQETLSHRIGTDKRPIYAINGALDYEFTKPYIEWALRDFGFDGAFPDLEIPREWSGLKYTNYQSRIYTENQHICFEAFTSSEPWNKKTAQDYAESRVVDYIGEEFGTRTQEPEFISAGNGLMRHNPNYLKRHSAMPSASNKRLKRAFFEWWLANHANDAQKAIIAGNAKIAAEHKYMASFNFERHENCIYYAKTAKDYKSISFAEFATMSKES